MNTTIIAVSALVFAVASFWWLHARRGRLVAAPPQAYALAVVPSRGVRLRLPLAIYNTGARALVVSNLRCRFLDLEDAAPQPWHSTRTTLRPLPEDFDDFPTPFPVEGRQAVSKALQFGDEKAPIELTAGRHRVLVEVDTGTNAHLRWRKLVEFELHVYARALQGSFIAHRNVDGHYDDG